MANGLSQSPEVPHIVLIGVPDVKALERVIQKLRDNHIEFAAFDEPDDNLGLTAVATVPLNEEQRLVFQNYKIWTEEEYFYTRVAQWSEHSGRLTERSAVRIGPRVPWAVHSVMYPVRIRYRPPCAVSSTM